MSPERMYRLLVVDDERNLRDGCARILVRLGYEVVQAEKGEEALAILAERPADVVLLDLKMPGMDGLDVLERIRLNHPDILVIIVTGFATIETAIEAMKKGAYDFMTKPFRPDQLRLIVERAVEHIRLKEERDRLSAERDRGLWAITTEKSRLRTVIDSIIPGLLITDADKRIVMCNPAFRKLMNIPPGDVTGSFTSDLSSLATLNNILTEITLAENSREDALTREFVIPGTRTTYIRATMNKVSGQTGEMLGIVAVLRDFTEQKEQEEEKSAFCGHANP